MKPPGKAGTSPALQGSDFSTTAGDARRAPPSLDKAQSSSVGVTCLVAVLSVGAVHALEAAGGLPLNDALPRAWQAVPAAVGKRHLQEKSPSRLMVPVPFYGKTLCFLQECYCLVGMLGEEPQMLTSPPSQNRHFAQ